MANKHDWDNSDTPGLEVFSERGYRAIEEAFAPRRRYPLRPRIDTERAPTTREIAEHYFEHAVRQGDPAACGGAALDSTRGSGTS